MSQHKGRLVAGAVAMLATVVVGANLALVYLATSDPSFAVEEDYYRKALAWDGKRAQDARNAALGWTVELDVSRGRSADGRVPVVARLRDAAGQPIGDALVRLEAFHNARAAHVLRVELGHRSGADYEATLPLGRPGLWEFRIEASRGGELFTAATIRELVRP